MLELRDVGFHYPRRDWVLRGLNLGVRPGTATAVLGPNGRGKTTLVRCAAGLLAPSEGAVRCEVDVGFVPQAHGGAFAYRVIDMVLMGRARRIGVFSSPGRDDRSAADDALEQVGVPELRNRQYPTLSGGEQQLVLVARAIAAQCPVLVLDEPTTGLDLHNQMRILALLAELVDSGIGVLLTTHHPDHALQLADSVAMMSGPGNVQVGPAADLLTDDALSALYGLDVHRISYHHDGSAGTTIVTRYGPRS